MPSRRQFLNTTVGLVSSLAASDSLLRFTPLRAEDAVVTPDVVQLTPDIEPIVRLIEDTPRERCFEMIAEQLRRGLPYRQFLAGLYLAGIRNVSPQPPGFKFHCVFVIHAAHQLSLDAPVEDRLLPLFWALDDFKASQRKDVEEGDFQLPPVTGKLPSPGVAWQEFDAAMSDWDEAKADHAIVALARNSSAHRIMESLWRYGARDYRNIGHKAIFVANTWRTLQTIGWRHAEPALRSLVLGLLDFGKSKRVNDYAFEDQSYLTSAEVARQTSRMLRGDWRAASQQTQATREVLDAIRSGRAEEAVRTAAGLLQNGQGGAPEIWDAVHLAAGELMMQQPGIYGIHTVTSTHALRYAYEMAADRETSLLMMFQGIGWMCQFHNFMVAKPQGLKKVKITELQPTDSDKSEVADIEGVFDLIEKDPAAAAARVIDYANVHPEPAEFVQTAHRHLLRTATDAHHFKYATSIFEDYHRVSAPWQPHMLATATYYLRGSHSPDSPVLQRAAEVIATF